MFQAEADPVKKVDIRQSNMPGQTELPVVLSLQTSNPIGFPILLQGMI